MFNKRLSNEELALLQSVIGSKFISYERGAGEVQFSRTYGNIRLNFSDLSIELENLETATLYCGEADNMSGFSCYSCSPDKEFKPYIKEATQVTEISEMVTGVEVAEDTIRIDNDEREISFSSAIIIRTQMNEYMFYRTYQYNENIFICNSDNYDLVYPVCNVIDDWSNDGDNQVSVERNIRAL